MAQTAVSGSASGIGAATRARLEAAGHHVELSGGSLDGLVACAGVAA